MVSECFRQGWYRYPRYRYGTSGHWSKASLVFRGTRKSDRSRVFHAVSFGRPEPKTVATNSSFFADSTEASQHFQDVACGGHQRMFSPCHTVKEKKDWQVRQEVRTLVVKSVLTRNKQLDEKWLKIHASTQAVNPSWLCIAGFCSIGHVIPSIDVLGRGA